MVTAIREVERALGDGVRRLTGDEVENQKAARRSLVASVDIRSVPPSPERCWRSSGPYRAGARSSRLGYRPEDEKRP